jgi:RND family efflux transporter MFP subunit
VAQRVAGVGDYLSVGTPIARLVKTDPLRLRLDVPERESGAIRTGLKVRVMVEGDTNIYTGKIARVAPALREADRMLAVEADVPAQGSLRVGRFVRAEIVVNESEAALVVPEPALIVFAGLEKVVSAKDGKVTEKAVTTGRRGADWVEIVSGLSAGEVVVLEPAGLRTGQPVIIESNSTTTSSGGTNSGGAR